MNLYFYPSSFRAESRMHKKVAALIIVKEIGSLERDVAFGYHSKYGSVYVCIFSLHSWII